MRATRGAGDELAGAEAHGCNHTERAVNWARVREELKACREAAKLGQVPLARKIGVNKSTINRIENVYGEPDHVPDLDTIERWTLATGVKVSDFFRRVEAPAAGAAHAQKGIAPSPPLTQGDRDDEDRTVSAERALAELRAILLRLGEVLTDAAAPPHPEKSRPAASARIAKSGRR